MTLPRSQDARVLYPEVREHCREVGDYVKMTLFEELLADEEFHIDFLETQLELHDRVDAKKYAKLNASRMDEST